MQSPRNVRVLSSVFSRKMECLMRLKSVSAVIVLGCISMLSACAVDSAAPENPVVAISASSATLIAATVDPCKLVVADPFWRQRGGQDGYEQRCGHSPPD